LEKKRAEQDAPRRWGGWTQGKVAQTMYTHVSKCKNNKIKKKNMIMFGDRAYIKCN
jgi:hypothetical protein